MVKSSTKNGMSGPLRSPMAGNLANAKSSTKMPCPKVAPNTTIPGSAPKHASPVQSPLPPMNRGYQHAGA